MNSESASHQTVRVPSNRSSTVVVRNGLRVLTGAALVTFVALGGSRHAAAELTKKGTWPTTASKPIAFEHTGTRDEALTLLAKKADWNIVSRLPPSAAPINVKINHATPEEILSSLLESDEHIIAEYTGSILTLRGAPATAPSAPTPSASPAPPASSEATRPDETETEVHKASKETAGRDLDVKGQDVEVTAGETYRDISVMGGNLHVRGTVTGDVVVTGGKITLHSGAVVQGDVTAIGGSLHLERGARVNGDAGVVGGIFTRDEGAVIRGDVSRKTDRPTSEPSFLRRFVSSLTSTFSVLFILGCLLQAFFHERIERLQTQLATQTMKSFASGVAYGVAGLALLALLCVTIIGIPFACVLGIGMALGTLAGQVALCTFVGGLLARHRTDNLYAHLAIGVALLALVQSLPWIGGIASVIFACIGFGAFAATRGAGLLDKPAKPLPAASAYRD
jgi:hypothetical protein